MSDDRDTETSRAARARDKLLSVYDVHGEKFRYLIVGMWNTAFGFGLFAIMWFATRHALTAVMGQGTAAVVVQWSSWFLSVPQGTTSMKYLAFRSKGKLLPQIVRAYFVYLPAQFLAMVILWTTTSVLHLPVLLGQIITIATGVVFSYFGHKYFTFRTPLEVGEVAPREMIEPGE